jgi:hypothetical protein
MATVTETVKATKDACHISLVPGDEKTRFVVTCDGPYLRTNSATPLELECEGKGSLGGTFWDKESAALLSDYSGVGQPFL